MRSLLFIQLFLLMCASACAEPLNDSLDDKVILDSGIQEGAETIAACTFAGTFLHDTKRYLTQEEWLQLKKGAHHRLEPADKDTNFLVYSRDGVELVYLLKEQPIIWQSHFIGNRLPNEMQNKKFYFQKFKIPEAESKAHSIEILCDSYDSTIIFERDEVKEIQVDITL